MSLFVPRFKPQRDHACLFVDLSANADFVLQVAELHKALHGSAPVSRIPTQRIPAKIRRKDRFFIFFIIRYLSVINPGEKVIIHLEISNRKTLARFVMRYSSSLIIALY